MISSFPVPPGVNHQSTQYASSGFWYDCDNIRFRSGRVESIGGWKRDGAYELDGIGRECFSMRDYRGNNFQFIGTDRKFYIINGINHTDITPVSTTEVVTGAALFKMILVETVTTALVEVTDVNHGVNIDDWVVFTGVTGGVGTPSEYPDTLMNQYEGFQVFSVRDDDHFTIYMVDASTDAPVLGDGTEDTWGTGYTIWRKVPSGLSAQVSGSGWGAGVWNGDQGWGLGAEESLITGTIRRVYMENYGEDMLLANSGGPIYYYDLSANSSAGVPTVPVGDVGTAKALSTFSGSVDTPIAVDSFLVSKKDGHCVALGCNDLGVTDSINSMLVRWSDQNNPFDWGPSATNTSGGQILRDGSRILGGVSTKDEVVIFTDSAVYSMRFIGPPDVFSFNLITSGVEIVCPRSAVNASNAVFFMGNDGFYSFTGQITPMDCPVANYVFDDFNYEQKAKVFGAVNSGFSEVVWFYPSSGSFENDRFVSFNYDERVWAYGQMDMSPLAEGQISEMTKNRTAWRDSIVFNNPMCSYIKELIPATNTVPLIEKSGIFSQENETSGDGAPVSSYVETGDIQVSDGSSFVFLSRYIPDVEFVDATGLSGEMTFSISTRDWPGEARSIPVSLTLNPTFAAGSMGRGATYSLGTGNDTALRSRGRSISFKYSNTLSNNFKWRLGDTRLDLRADGKR